MICKGELDKINLKDNLKLCEIEKNTFLNSVAVSLLCNERSKKNWNIIDKKSKTIDSIFTQAQKEISEGKHFKETELFDMINSLVLSKISFCIWYGNDWNDLTLVSKDEIFKHIEAELLEMPGEIYLFYKANDCFE